MAIKFKLDYQNIQIKGLFGWPQISNDVRNIRIKAKKENIKSFLIVVISESNRIMRCARSKKECEQIKTKLEPLGRICGF